MKMVKRSIPEPEEKVAGKADPTTLSAHKRTSSEFGSLTRGGEDPELSEHPRSGSRQSEPATHERASAAPSHISVQAQEGYRDIGELSFGPLPEPEAGIADASSPASRRRVPNERVMPWSAVCDLVITARDNQPYSGTAWFISPTMLVTAGHCVFVHAPQTAVHGFVKEIRVMPARRGEFNSSQSLFGWAVAPEGSFQAHDQWTLNGLRDFDYGVISLPASTPLGQQTGIFRYGNFQQLKGSTPIISGYPDDVPLGTIPEGTQWFEQNRITDATERRVTYDIFTVRGMSGSPVFFELPGTGFAACAIHNFGDEEGNTGVRINQEVADQLDAWLGI